MPRRPRIVAPGYPHHVTQRGVRRQSTFPSESDFNTYLRLAGELLDEHPVEIWAYCLMPNHIHAVVVPEATDSLSQFFARLHQRYARLINLKYDWQGHLWQERYYSVPMDESHTIAALRYVELNPVRAKLAVAPEDWAWSSARGNLGISDDPLLSNAPAHALVSNWRQYLSAAEDKDQLLSLRQQTRMGVPEGSDEFVCAIESASGCQIKRHQGGARYSNRHRFRHPI